VNCLLVLQQYEFLRDVGTSILVDPGADHKAYFSKIFPTDRDLLIGVSYYAADCMMSDQHFGPLRRGTLATSSPPKNLNSLKQALLKNLFVDVENYEYACRCSESRYDDKSMKVVEALGLVARIQNLNHTTRCLAVYCREADKLKKVEHPFNFDYGILIMNQPSILDFVKNRKSTFKTKLHLETYNKSIMLWEDIESQLSLRKEEGQWSSHDNKRPSIILCPEIIKLVQKVVKGFGGEFEIKAFDLQRHDSSRQAAKELAFLRWNISQWECSWTGIATNLFLQKAPHARYPTEMPPFPKLFLQ
jgi:hypothetical protein